MTKQSVVSTFDSFTKYAVKIPIVTSLAIIVCIMLQCGCAILYTHLL